MATINSTISVITTDTLPVAININGKSTITTTGNFTEYGTLTIDSEPTEQSFLSNTAVGAKGGILYIQSPSTNQNPIHLLGLQQVDEELANELTAEGAEPFSTLYPGETTLIHLSAQQGKIVAYTTYGTGSLNYYIADKGGELGHSELVLLSGSGNWEYFVQDADLVGMLPNSFGAKNLLLPTSDWNYSDQWIIQDQSYVLSFVSSSDSNYQKYVHIDPRGNYTVTDINMYDVSWWYPYYLQAKGLALVYNSGSNAIVNNYTADGIYTSIFNNSGYSYVRDDYYSNNEGDYFANTNDGSFVVQVQNYNGGTGSATFLINKDSSTLLFTDGNYKYVDTAAVHPFANFVFVAIYDDYNNKYDKIQYWSTTGVLLKNIDVSNYNFNDLNYRFYGTNKMVGIFQNGDNYDYIFAYDGATDNLVGVNQNNNFYFSHFNTGNYDQRRVFAYDKWITDSIRQGYVWNKGMYNPESFAIAYFSGSNDDSYFINWTVDFMDVVHWFPGQSDLQVVTIIEGTSKSIRIPYESGYNKCYPSEKAIVFSTAPSVNTGSLSAITITTKGINTYSIIPDLSVVNNNYSDIYFKPVGDYIMYNWYNTSTDKTSYTMLAPTGKTDTVTINGEQQYDGVWRTRFNTLLLRSWNYDWTRNWYFNTGTGRFVELTNGGSSFNVNTPYYPAHYINYSANKNGVNDGNILLGPYDNDDLQAPYNNSMRLLKKGVATANVTLPETDGNWELNLGSDAVYLAYQDSSNSYTWTVKVYDLNLNLVRTVVTENDSVANSYTVGKRFIFNQQQDSDTAYYMVSLNGATVFTNPTSEEFLRIINDYYNWY